jgi:hypothetical protein
VRADVVQYRKLLHHHQRLSVCAGPERCDPARESGREVVIERLGYLEVDLIVCRTMCKLRRQPAASGCALTCFG